LGRFEAVPAGNAIHLEWETATELNSLGFHLYRGQSRAGDRQRLNNTLIPAQNAGVPTGSIYSWQDQDVDAGTTYYYWLEDVDARGESRLHGPVESALPAYRLLPPFRTRPAPRPGLKDRP
jgi:hypothetical protein